MPDLSIALIQKASRGDRRAVRELVDLLLPMVHHRVARTLLRHRRGTIPAARIRAEIEDLIQSVLLYLLNDGARALLEWSSASGMPLATYVALMAEREASAILQSRRGSLGVDEFEEDEMPSLQRDPARTGDAKAIRRDVRPALLPLLDRLRESLGERDAELFHLLVIEERSVAEICTLMDMTPEAVHAARGRSACVARRLAAELIAEAAPASSHKPNTGHG